MANIVDYAVVQPAGAHEVRQLVIAALTDGSAMRLTLRSRQEVPKPSEVTAVLRPRQLFIREDGAWRVGSNGEVDGTLTTSVVIDIPRGDRDYATASAIV